MYDASTTATESHAPIHDEYCVLRAENAELREQLVAMQHQLEVFKKLLFGPRSEKRPFDIPGRGTLFEDAVRPGNIDEPKQKIEYERGAECTARLLEQGVTHAPLFKAG